MVLGSPENVAFDYLTTPADPEMGVLAEIFRTYPGVRLNDHPAARFAILGPLAEELFKDAPLHDYFSNGSVLQKLTDHRGWILRLGADRDTVTLTHWAEYLAEIPDKKRVRRRYVRRDTGELWIESLNDCEGIREGVGRDYFPQILNDFLARGNGRIGQVGNARAELFSAPAFVDFAVDWLEGKFGTSE
jgi:aminoglycoside N3'-acetyltransferase